MDGKNCFNCMEAKIYGKNIPATQWSPVEYAVTECTCEDRRIDIYFSFLEEIVKKYNYREDDNSRAKFCPFYLRREEK